jgi:hypothetical protein
MEIHTRPLLQRDGEHWKDAAVAAVTGQRDVILLKAL